MQAMTFDWDERAAGWDENPDMRTYAVHAYTSLTGSIDLAGLRILSFGCGTGLLSAKMARDAAHVVALDPSPKMIDVVKAKSLPNVSRVVGTLSAGILGQVPCFDLVTAASVCAFVPDYPETLQQLRALLALGGRFVQWDWLTEAPDFGFTEKDILSALTDAGFSDVTVTQPFTISRGDDGSMPVLMAVATAA
jgi:SAM-dependent methyltransferase